jgi:hypothetical protein
VGVEDDQLSTSQCSSSGAMNSSSETR